jgi:hypothetical protein
MDIDYDKVDEMALALLYLTAWKEGVNYRAWKGIDWDVANRLYENDLIMNPKNKNKSIAFTISGFNRCKELFEKHFAK